MINFAFACIAEMDDGSFEVWKLEVYILGLGLGLGLVLVSKFEQYIIGLWKFWKFSS